MIVTYRYRLLPTKRQHRALEHILESQRQLYNAALKERIDAYCKAGLTRTFFDQTKALTEWRSSDPEAAGFPVNLQRATLRRLDEAYKGFFGRVLAGRKAGFPRFAARAGSIASDSLSSPGSRSRALVCASRPCPGPYGFTCTESYRSARP